MNHPFTKSTKHDGMPPDNFSIGHGVLEDELATKKDDDDDAILRANGHEAAMPRQFDWTSALGLGFSITNSWIGYLVSRTVYNHLIRDQPILTSVIELLWSRIDLWRSTDMHLQLTSCVLRPVRCRYRARRASFCLSGMDPTIESKSKF